MLDNLRSSLGAALKKLVGASDVNEELIDSLCKDVQRALLQSDVNVRLVLTITQNLKKPTYQVSIIIKPTEQKFEQLLNDFWWDTTYVAKSLARDELFYAKFMSENNIRTDYLIPLIEWHIAIQHDWKITTNKFGRLFKNYLTSEMWQKVEQTFSGSIIEDNWNALFAMADLVSEIGKELSEKLGFEYPIKLETDIRKYLLDLKESYLDKQ